MGRRGLVRTLVTLAATVAGAVILSGSGQPVTAHPYPRWQEVAPPPLAPRTHALGVHLGPRVLMLGGLDADGSAVRDGASYDLRTGRWHHLTAPAAFSDRDRAVTAAGVLVVQHGPRWWRYDARRGVWSRMRDLPPRLHAPSAFHSEVYALSGRRVVVYSVQLGRWTRWPFDGLRPRLRAIAVAASPHGTVVTGYVGGRRVADRWDGVGWHRSDAARDSARPSGGHLVSGLQVGGRLFVVRGGRAWIRLP